MCWQMLGQLWHVAAVHHPWTHLCCAGGETKIHECSILFFFVLLLFSGNLWLVRSENSLEPVRVIRTSIPAHAKRNRTSLTPSCSGRVTGNLLRLMFSWWWLVWIQCGGTLLVLEVDWCGPQHSDVYCTVNTSWLHSIPVGTGKWCCPRVASLPMRPSLTSVLIPPSSHSGVVESWWRGRLTGWLIGCLFEWSDGQLVSEMVSWIVGWRPSWLTALLSSWLAGDWLVEWAG